MSSKVTSNGRVTIPRWVRDYLGIVPGTQVVFRPLPDSTAAVERADGTQPPSRLSKAPGDAGPCSSDET
jgi:antitoxin PrlF